MALHTASFPRFRQAPQPREDDNRSATFAWSQVIPMDRLNELTSDAKVRLHVTSLFVVGMAALVAVLTVI
jgi:hypothetical protein